MLITNTLYFEVVCMTIYHSNGNTEFHLPPVAQVATMVTTQYTKDFGVDCGVAKVNYADNIYQLIYLRSGLDAQCVVLGISRKDKTIDLYTDKPMPGTQATPMFIRQLAKRAMSEGKCQQLGFSIENMLKPS